MNARLVESSDCYLLVDADTDEIFDDFSYAAFAIEWAEQNGYTVVNKEDFTQNRPITGR